VDHKPFVLGSVTYPQVAREVRLVRLRDRLKDESISVPQVLIQVRQEQIENLAELRLKEGQHLLFGYGGSAIEIDLELDKIVQIRCAGLAPQSQTE